MAVAAVIGGAGRMGEWFATFLKGNGYEVTISDKNRSRARKLAQQKKFHFAKDVAQATSEADIVILATPTSVTKEILEQTSQKLMKGKLLVEISSVKEPVKDTIRKLRRKGINILSIHPMFGPGIRSLRKQPVLVVPSAYTDSVAETFLSILKRKGAQIVPIDFDSHDRYVAATLALPHFANIVFANVLRSLKIDPNRLRELAGTTFRLQLLCAEAVCHEPLDNESSILMDNPESARVLGRFYHQSEAIMSIVKNGTGKRLARELMRSRDFLRKDKEFARAYAQFNAAANVAGLT